MFCTQRGCQKMRDKENSLKNEEHGIKDKSTYLKTTGQCRIPERPGLGPKPFVVTTDGIPYSTWPIEGSAHTSWWYSTPSTQCLMNPSSFVLSLWLDPCQVPWRCSQNRCCHAKALLNLWGTICSPLTFVPLALLRHLFLGNATWRNISGAIINTA